MKWLKNFLSFLMLASVVFAPAILVVVILVPLFFGLIGGRLVHRAFPAITILTASLWSGLSIILVCALIFWGSWRYEDFKKRRRREIGIFSGREIHSDPEVEKLIRELIQIRHTSSYLGKPGGIYDDTGHHKRAREIGEILFNNGGHGLMVRAAERTINSGAGEGEISGCWHGVGQWLA